VPVERTDIVSQVRVRGVALLAVLVVIVGSVAGTVVWRLEARGNQPAVLRGLKIGEPLENVATDLGPYCGGGIVGRSVNHFSTYRAWRRSNGYAIALFSAPKIQWNPLRRSATMWQAIAMQFNASSPRLSMTYTASAKAFPNFCHGHRWQQFPSIPVAWVPS
jgi:hypothetical protein